MILFRILKYVRIVVNKHEILSSSFNGVLRNSPRHIALRGKPVNSFLTEFVCFN